MHQPDSYTKFPGLPWSANKSVLLPMNHDSTDCEVVSQSSWRSVVAGNKLVPDACVRNIGEKQKSPTINKVE